MTISQTITLLAFCVLTGSYTWGMRGTIVGGERGAMLPGAALALVLLHAGGSVPVAAGFPIAAAVGAAGMFFGGAQTYGDTIALTHEQDGSVRFFARLGLAIKGSVWFGIFAGMLGFSVGAMAGRYALWETILFVCVLPVVKWLGVMICNTPYKPKENKFPRLYFSRTRREVWGGMLFVFLYILAFSFVKHEWMTVLLAGFGFVFGALGFWLGNLFQTFADRRLSKQWIGGWKWMECVFGGVGALGVGLGWSLLYDSELQRYVYQITAHSGVWSPFPETTETLMAFIWLILLALYLVRYGMRSSFGQFLNRTEDVWIWPVFCYVPLFLALTGNQFFAELFSSFGIVFVLAEKIAFASRKKYAQVPLAPVLQGVLILFSAVILAVQLFAYSHMSAYALWVLYLLPYLLTELYIAFNPIRLRARVEKTGSLRAAFAEIGSHRSWMAYACVCTAVLLIWGKSYFLV
ncbi:MAG: hypothetical protein IJT44_07380 [Clostridia bacterium]|nr:hypothetical protein [Clostridia bacterium]